MTIKSSPFGPTILSGEDAEQFRRQMRDDPPPEAHAAVRRGRVMLLEYVQKGYVTIKQPQQEGEK